MGRPINKKYFGNLNSPYNNVATGGLTGNGGEGVTGVVISNSGTNYSAGTTVSFTAPQLPNSTTAQGTITLGTGGDLGKIMRINITNAGSGYTAAPTVTLTTASTVNSVVNSGIGGLNTFTVTTATGIAVGMLISGGSTGVSGYVTTVAGNVITSTVANSGTWTNATNLFFFDFGTGFADTVTLSSTTMNAIAGVAYLTTGSSAVAFDIEKQESSHRYLVRTAQGRGQCKLVAAAPAAGQMTIIATDYNGNTYYVTKLTSRKALLTRKTQNGVNAWVYGVLDSARWTLGSAVGTDKTLSTTKVSIANN